MKESTALWVVFALGVGAVIFYVGRGVGWYSVLTVECPKCRGTGTVRAEMVPATLLDVKR